MHEMNLITKIECNRRLLHVQSSQGPATALDHTGGLWPSPGDRSPPRLHTGGNENTSETAALDDTARLVETIVADNFGHAEILQAGTND